MRICHDTSVLGNNGNTYIYWQLHIIDMNTTIFRKISETIKTNVVQVPHPTLVGIGLCLGVAAVIAAGIAVFSDPSHMAHVGFMHAYGPVQSCENCTRTLG
jgi:hypothetical protein